MSNPMQRIVSRPFGGRTISGGAPAAQPAPQSAPAATNDTDYMVQEDDQLREHWLNPHVAAFHAQRAAPRPASNQQATAPAPLRTMTAEQRAAYIAQRDAENAAAAGSDMHPAIPSPRSPVPPTPTLPTQFRSTTLTAPPPGKGAAQRRPSPEDMPVTPQNSSDPDGTDAGHTPYPRMRPAAMVRAPAEQPAAQPEPQPQAAETVPAPMRPLTPPPRTSSLVTAPAEELHSPLHMVPPARRRSAVQGRADIEVEVRGAGTNRVVTIRFLTPASPGSTAVNVASAATSTR